MTSLLTHLISIGLLCLVRVQPVPANHPDIKTHCDADGVCVYTITTYDEEQNLPKFMNQTTARLLHIIDVLESVSARLDAFEKRVDRFIDKVEPCIPQCSTTLHPFHPTSTPHYLPTSTAPPASPSTRQSVSPPRSSVSPSKGPTPSPPPATASSSPKAASTFATETPTISVPKQSTTSVPIPTTSPYNPCNHHPCHHGTCIPIPPIGTSTMGTRVFTTGNPGTPTPAVSTGATPSSQLCPVRKDRCSSEGVNKDCGMCKIQFYVCTNGQWSIHNCPTGLVWKETGSDSGACVWPYQAGCSGTTFSDPAFFPTGALRSSNEETTVLLTTVSPDNHCPSKPGTCQVEGQFQDCGQCKNQYYRCVHGKWSITDCPGGTVWYQAAFTCAWPYQAGCAGTTDSDGTDLTMTDTDAPETTALTSDSSGGDCPPKPGNCNVEGQFEDCGFCKSQYYRCIHGQWTINDCPNETVWDQAILNCAWPYQAGCGPSTVSEATFKTTHGRTSPRKSTQHTKASSIRRHTTAATHPFTSKTRYTTAGYSTQEDTETATHLLTTEADYTTGAHSETGQAGSSSGTPYRRSTYPITEATTAEELSTTLPDGLCPFDPNECSIEGQFKNCGQCKVQFYRCIHGHWTINNCPQGTVWDQSLLTCAWPYQAGCSAGLGSDFQQGDASRWSYICKCDPGWVGYNCSHHVNPCASTKDNDCGCGSTCVDNYNGTYHCVCEPGYTGQNCCQIIDHCDPNPCKNNGTCISSRVGHKCICPDWTSGPDCGEIIVCHPKDCGKNADCYVSHHKKYCVCKPGYSGNPYKECDIKQASICGSGDPHYKSLDNRHYSYQGTCPYVLTEPCNYTEILPGFPPFAVYAQNEQLTKGSRVSFVHQIDTQVYGMDIKFLKGGRLVVNNLVTPTPWAWPPNTTEHKLTVHHYGSRGLVLDTDFHLRSVYDGYSSTCIYVPIVPGYQDHMCAFGGTMDGNPMDDFKMPDGQLAPDANTFGDSWITSDKNCIKGSDMKNINCTPSVSAKARQECEILSDPNGPFAMCSNLTALIDRLTPDCQYDLCAYALNHKIYCNILANFAHQCQSLLPGVILDWRNTTGCPLPCPAHSHYTPCGPPCPTTCANITSTTCNLPCLEGCECNDGYVRDGDKCILISDCGCTDDGQYYPSGYTWIDDNCTTECNCSGGYIGCHDIECVDHAHCGIDNYRRDCYCDVGFRGDGLKNCTDIDECVESHPCVHGNCTNTIGSYTCTCEDGWTGKNCDHEIDYCLMEPCDHNGTCIREHPGYRCECPVAWAGYNCDFPVDLCNITGNCVHGDCTWEPGSYNCSCNPGWQGPHCNTDINECRTEHPCKCGSTCVNTPGSYKCICKAGYTGQDCCTPINDCDLYEPCENGGTCVYVGPGKYRCICPGDTTGRNCSKKIVCTSSSCGGNADCYVSDHKINCVCKPGYSGNPWPGHSCSLQTRTSCASGDPHYVSYDHHTFSYQGTCPYVFTKPCKNMDLPLVPFFNVTAQNAQIPPHSAAKVSYITRAFVTTYGHLVEMGPNQEDYFDGSRIYLPYYFPNRTNYQIAVLPLGSRGSQVQTDFHLQVLLYAQHEICVVVPYYPELEGKLCGLAGNMNNNPNDDQKTPNGTEVANVNTFGDSWITNDDTHPACDKGTDFGPGSCKPDDHRISRERCAIIMDTSGPFAVCQQLTQLVAQADKDCIYDDCAHHHSNKSLCHSLTTFAQRCQKMLPGTALHWRTPTFCPMDCGANSHYSPCATNCPQTCPSGYGPPTCAEPCTEGCDCDDGFVLSNTGCVPLSDCGCSDSCGNYHPPNTTWVNPDCSESFACYDGTIHTELIHCVEHAHCKSEHGKRDCYCDKGFYPDPSGRTNCTDIDECALHTDKCEHNSTCINTPGSYTCHCPPDYRGEYCQTYVNPCRNVQCQHGGHCIDQGGNATCICTSGYWGDRCQHLPQRHCADLQQYHDIIFSGVYTILLYNTKQQLRVYCDMDTEGGGWTLIQRREDGETDFYRLWDEYQQGFGNPASEHWIGNDNLNYLTHISETTLRVDMDDCDNGAAYEEYDNFYISDGSDKYRLHVGTHRGPAQDALSYTAPTMNQNGMQFSTKDQDNDNHPDQSCAVMYQAGFWFNACGASNLNGIYYSSCLYHHSPANGIFWFPWKYSMTYSAKKVEMKIRPTHYKPLA